ncbi:apolipoprotein acyltransferase [Roseivivax sp. CAU 1753]
MIVIIAALVGGIWGGWTAKKRRGNGLDIAQYAAVYAIGFALLGLFATIAIEKVFV